jgi:hypothetical protein
MPQKTNLNIINFDIFTRFVVNKKVVWKITRSLYFVEEMYFRLTLLLLLAISPLISPIGLGRKQSAGARGRLLCDGECS